MLAACVSKFSFEPVMSAVFVGLPGFVIDFRHKDDPSTCSRVLAFVISYPTHACAAGVKQSVCPSVIVVVVVVVSTKIARSRDLGVQERIMNIAHVRGGGGRVGESVTSTFFVLAQFCNVLYLELSIFNYVYPASARLGQGPAPRPGHTRTCVHYGRGH